MRCRTSGSPVLIHRSNHSIEAAPLDHKHKIDRTLIEEMENALTAIIGSAEIFLEDGVSKHNAETSQRIESTSKATLIIKETFEEY